jgi:hypothetical protein
LHASHRFTCFNFAWALSHLVRSPTSPPLPSPLIFLFPPAILTLQPLSSASFQSFTRTCSCTALSTLMPPKLHEAPTGQQRVQPEGKVQRYFPNVKPDFAKSRADDDTGDVRIGGRRGVPAAPSGKALPEAAIELDYGRRVKAKAEIVEEDARRPTERFKAQIVKEESDEEDADAAQRRRDAMRRQAGAGTVFNFVMHVFI